MSRRKNRIRKTQLRQKNMMLQGNGASGRGDRGALQSASLVNSNPYDSSNTIYRWQEYTRWYMKSWEARKVIDIPVEDALRLPFEINGIDPQIAKDLKQAYEFYNLPEQNRRALIQERLYGGCIQVPVLRVSDPKKLDTPLDLATVGEGDLLAFNVVDISRITQVDYDTNPLSAEYDTVSRYNIDGVTLDKSRLIVFDGSPLVNRATTNILQANRVNPSGFGESKLASLYDSLVRFVGTQQAAYHLINMSSVLLMKAGNLMQLEAVDNPVMQKMEEIVNQISIYRGAILDAKDAEISQHSASFGSVPELLTTFAQFLCAGTDVPATRFMSQSPGGLNATGDSDSQNYFNMINSYQNNRIKPRIMRQFDFIGASLMGWGEFSKIRHQIEIEFPPLWSETAKEKSETDRTYVDALRSLHELEVISREKLVEELIARGVFKTSDEVTDFIESEIGGDDPLGLDAINPDKELSKLEQIVKANEESSQKDTTSPQA